jgi:hypothetical protein
MRNIKRIKAKKIGEKEKLNEINTLAKKFFQEFFYLDKNLSYSELIEKFEKIKKPEYILFCQKMLEEYYSDKTLTKEKVEQIADLLAKTIIKERKISERKDEEKQDSLKNEHILEFIKHNNEAHRILNSFYKDKELMKLSRKPVTSEKESSDFFKNQKALEEIRKLSTPLKKAYIYFKVLFNSAYERASQEEKYLMKKLAEDWNSERKKIFSMIKNPIRQHMLEVYLFDKHYKKFKNITARK